MKKLHLLTLLVVLLALFGAAAAQAGKQAICHFPPGNEANFHTIMVSDNAVDNHVAKHGDLIGSCLENCETICDDGLYCTQDVQADPDQCICLAAPRPEIDCNDSLQCTVDSCNEGEDTCMYDADILEGETCDDDDPGTTGEVCSGGECLAASCPSNLITGSSSWTTTPDYSGISSIRMVATFRNTDPFGRDLTLTTTGMQLWTQPSVGHPPYIVHSIPDVLPFGGTGTVDITIPVSGYPGEVAISFKLRSLELGNVTPYNVTLVSVSLVCDEPPPPPPI